MENLGNELRTIAKAVQVQKHSCEALICCAKTCVALREKELRSAAEAGVFAYCTSDLFLAERDLLEVIFPGRRINSYFLGVRISPIRCGNRVVGIKYSWEEV